MTRKLPSPWYSKAITKGETVMLPEWERMLNDYAQQSQVFLCVNKIGRIPRPCLYAQRQIHRKVNEGSTQQPLSYMSTFMALISFFQFSSVAQSCPTVCVPMDGSTPGFPVLHQLAELTQTRAHGVGDAIQPSRPLSSPCTGVSASASFFAYWHFYSFF